MRFPRHYSFSHTPLILLSVSLFFQLYCYTINLANNWFLQSSEEIVETGDIISKDAFDQKEWYPITVPATVLAGLIANDVYKEPFFSKNLSSIPDSEFENPWWYRTEFILPDSEEGKKIWLKFDGINYRANIWLNGEKIADSLEVVGAYSTFEFDITEKAVTGTDSNVIAVEVFRCEKFDLAINFVDWAPHPADSSMGLFKPVHIKTSGPVKLRHPFVKNELDIPSLSQAKLTVLADVTNGSNESVTGTVTGTIGSITFSKEITLTALEKKVISFSHADFSELVISSPVVWWPWQMGDQPMYSLNLTFEIGNAISDSITIDFGIRQITSRLTDKNYLLYSVNGKDLLIRGAGWCPDLFLRRDPQLIEAEVRYVRDMNLNTIRLEGKLEEEDFYNACDRLGILVMPGWCCSYLGNGWERWEYWDAEDHAVAYASTRAQIYRHRNHPCVLTWYYASDRLPPEDVEQNYLDIFEELSWPNPTQASAGLFTSTLTGITGVKMSGPYKWVPPTYWFQETQKGGYFSFNTETSPGAAVPPLESIQEFIPADNLWPIDNTWTYHCGIEHFKDLQVFTEAMDNRYGKSESVEEYCVKAQVAAYESHRAMFEAYSENKYTSTGIIQWMLNNAWPSMIWHLYDYYLRPGGSYFGAKTGCRPLHIQYNVNSRSVAVVNSYYTSFNNLKATAAIYTIDAEQKFTQEATVSLGPDEVKPVITIPVIDTISTTYFLKLTLSDENGTNIDNNSYWLSTKNDVLDWAGSTSYITPVSDYGDLTQLQNLDSVILYYTSSHKQGAIEDSVIVTVINPASAIAFAVRLQLLKDTDNKEILPILWDDNYIMLVPGEKRTITARYQKEYASGAAPLVKITGWNVKGTSTDIKTGSTKISYRTPRKCSIIIYNLLGRKVFEKTYKANLDKMVSNFSRNNFSLKRCNIARGMYIVQMKSYFSNVSKPNVSNKRIMHY